MTEKLLVILAADESLPEIESRILASALRQSEEKGDLEGVELVRAELAKLGERLASATTESDNGAGQQGTDEMIALDDSEPAVVLASDNIVDVEVQEICRSEATPEPTCNIDSVTDCTPSDMRSGFQTTIVKGESPETGNGDDERVVGGSPCAGQVNAEIISGGIPAAEPVETFILSSDDVSSIEMLMDGPLPESVHVPDFVPLMFLEACVDPMLAEPELEPVTPDAVEVIDESELVIDELERIRIANFVAVVAEAIEEAQPVVEVEAVSAHAVLAMSKKKGDSGGGKKSKGKKPKHRESDRAKTVTNDALPAHVNIPDGIVAGQFAAPHMVLDDRSEELAPLGDLPDIPLGEETAALADVIPQNGDHSHVEVEPVAEFEQVAAPPGGEIYATIDFGEDAIEEAPATAAEDEPEFTPEVPPEVSAEQRAEVYSQLDLGDVPEGDSTESSTLSVPEAPAQEIYSQLDLGTDALEPPAVPYGTEVYDALDLGTDTPQTDPTVPPLPHGEEIYSRLDLGDETPESEKKVYATIDFGMPEIFAADRHVSWHAISGRPEPIPEAPGYYDTLGTLSTDPPEIIHICFIRAVRRLLRRQLTADKLNNPEFRRSLRLTGVAFHVLQNGSTRADYDLRQKGLREPASGQKLMVPEDANGPTSVGKVKISLSELMLLTRMFGEGDIMTVINAARMLPEEGFWEYLSGSFAQNPLALESLQLGYQMLRHGLISVVQFEHAYYAALQGQQRLSEILVEAGWVNPEALDRLLTGRPVEAEVEAPKIVEIAVEQKEERGSQEVKMGAAAVPDWANSFDWSENPGDDSSAAVAPVVEAVVESVAAAGPESVAEVVIEPDAEVVIEPVADVVVEPVAETVVAEIVAEQAIVEMPEGWSEPDSAETMPSVSVFVAPEDAFRAILEGSVLEREEVPAPEPLTCKDEPRAPHHPPIVEASAEAGPASPLDPPSTEIPDFMQPLDQLDELPIENVVDELPPPPAKTGLDAVPELSEAALDSLIGNTDATVEQILGGDFADEHLSMLLAGEEQHRKGSDEQVHEEMPMELSHSETEELVEPTPPEDEELGPGFYTLLQSMKEKGVDLGPGFRQLMKKEDEDSSAD